MALQEQDKKKLDTIVSQMVQNGETDRNIQMVVNDFKSKYEKAAETPAAPVGKKYFGKDANAVIGADILPGIGKFLGMNSFGTGLSTLIPGEEAITGAGKAREAQAAEQAAIDALSPETLRRMGREGKTLQPSGAIEDLTSATTHDLTNRQVLGSAVATGANILGGAVSGGKTLLGRSLAGAGVGGLSAGAIQADDGGDWSDIGKSTAVGAAIGGAIPGLGYVAKKGIKSLGKVLGETMELFGTSQEAVATAFNPGSKEGKKAFDAARKGKIGGIDILKKAERAMTEFSDNMRTEYRANLKNVPDVPVDKGAIVSQVDDILNEYNVIKTKKGLDFSKSVISDAGDVARIESMYNDLVGWSDNTVLGLDTLKKRLTNSVNKLQGGGAEFVLSQRVRNAVGDTLKTSSKPYADMVGRYDDLIDMANEIKGTLSLGKKSGKAVNPKTAFNKVLRVLARNSDFEQAVLGNLDQATGANLKQMIAGASFNPIVAPGLSRQFQTGAALTAAGGLVAGIPGVTGTALAGLIGLSPRVQGLLARGAGAVARPVGAALGPIGGLSAGQTGLLSGLLANPTRRK